MQTAPKIPQAIVANQRGVFFPLIGIGLVVLIGVLAFVIDLPRKEVTSQELRRAMDSAALAAAQKLDGTAQSLALAVQFADEMMAANHVAGRALEFSQYNIEFGLYSFTEKKFTHLAKGDAYRNLIGEPYPPNPEFKGVPIASLINSVRVNASQGADSLFSRVIGAMNLGNVSGNAVAVADRQSKVCAFPFAIPMCSLFINQDPNIPVYDGIPSKLTTQEYEVARQCKRPIFVTEANHAYEDAPRGKDLGDGLLRAMSYPRPEVVSYGPENVCGVTGGTSAANCLSMPIIGTWAVPRRKDTNSDGVVDDLDFDYLWNDESGPGESGSINGTQLSQLLHDLKEGRNRPTTAAGPSEARFPCIDFSIGELVSPLESYYDGGASKLNTGSSILVPEESGASSSSGSSAAPFDETAIDELFSSLIANPSNKKLTEVFGDPRNGSAKDNFPFLRGGRLETRIIGARQHQVVAGEMKPNEWTNPMCHYDGWHANDFDNARVLKVVVPLIMPDAPQGGDGDFQVSYCDPASEVGTSKFVLGQAPYKNTFPRVVGFVEANIFDFNFRWLPNTGHSVTMSPTDSPDYWPSRSGGQIVDSIPAGGLMAYQSSSSNSSSGSSGNQGNQESSAGSSSQTEGNGSSQPDPGVGGASDTDGTSGGGSGSSSQTKG